MSYELNPFTKKLQISSSGAGGGTYPEVETFADLPAAENSSQKVYLVKTKTGALLTGDRKLPGLYSCDGISWVRLAENQLKAYDSNLLDGKPASDYASAEAQKEHEDNKDNPHETTKEQIGLDKVDNTSDADKPISDATQAALDGKQVNIYAKINVEDVSAENVADYQLGDLIKDTTGVDYQLQEQEENGVIVTAFYAVSGGGGEGVSLPSQVTAEEIVDGVEEGLRSFSPKDVAEAAQIHGGGEGGVTEINKNIVYPLNLFVGEPAELEPLDELNEITILDPLDDISDLDSLPEISEIPPIEPLQELQPI